MAFARISVSICGTQTIVIIIIYTSVKTFSPREVYFYAMPIIMIIIEPLDCIRRAPSRKDESRVLLRLRNAISATQFLLSVASGDCMEAIQVFYSDLRFSVLIQLGVYVSFLSMLTKKTDGHSSDLSSGFQPSEFLLHRGHKYRNKNDFY